MIRPDDQYLASTNTTSNSELEQRRLLALSRLGIPRNTSVPVFDEAAQTAAHFLGASICILSFVERDRQYFKAAVGLSRIGLMNDLATSRQIPRETSFCNTVVKTQRPLAIENATEHSDYKDSLLVQRYGIQAYLGVPLFNSEGYCLGTLAVMELTPHQFTAKDIGFLELIARWSMSEIERNQLLDNQNDLAQADNLSPAIPPEFFPESGTPQPATQPTLFANDGAGTAVYANTVKGNLIAHMLQDLRTPLTSILGMASVLTREIYGSLTGKQKEYIDIIHGSSQAMLALVDETIELGGIDAFSQMLDLSEVELELFCQQCLKKLNPLCEQREQEIQLTIEPGQRTWTLDKVKVKQMLYHLVFRVIHVSNPGSRIRVHVSRKANQLNLAIWASHPFLEEGLPHTELCYASGLAIGQPVTPWTGTGLNLAADMMPANVGQSPVQATLLSTAMATHSVAQEQQVLQNRQNLGILLCQILVQMHEGSLSVQGSAEAGYRYVLALPHLPH